MACYRKTAGGRFHHLPCAVPVELDAMNNSGSSSSMEACRRKTINAAIAGSLCQGEAKSGCGPIPTFYPMSFFKLFLISSRERATATDLFIAVMQTEQAVRRKVGANEGAKIALCTNPIGGDLGPSGPFNVACVGSCECSDAPHRESCGSRREEKNAPPAKSSTTKGETTIACT